MAAFDIFEIGRQVKYVEFTCGIFHQFLFQSYYGGSKCQNGQKVGVFWQPLPQNT